MLDSQHWPQSCANLVYRSVQAVDCPLQKVRKEEEKQGTVADKLETPGR